MTPYEDATQLVRTMFQMAAFADYFLREPFIQPVAKGITDGLLESTGIKIEERPALEVALYGGVLAKFADNFEAANEALQDTKDDYACVNPTVVSIGASFYASGHEAAYSIAYGIVYQIAKTIRLEITRSGACSPYDMPAIKGEPACIALFFHWLSKTSRELNAIHWWPSARAELDARDKVLTEDTVAQVMAQLSWEAARVKPSADTKTDTKKKIQTLVPKNDGVTRPARKIKKEIQLGGSKTGIALDFTRGDESRAKTLLRQLRGDRYKHLLG